MKWEKVTLDKLVEKPISGEWGKEVQGTAIATKVIRSTNFTNEGKINLSKGIALRTIDPKKVEQKKLKFGDILIEKSGGSPKQPVGRVIFFDQKEDVFLFSNFTSVLRPKNNVFPKYLHYQLFANHSYGVTEGFQNKTTGIINLQLNRYVKKIKIPLPPLHIQKQIAEILDIADALRRTTQEQLEALNDLAQAVFFDMFGDPVSNDKKWEKSILKNYIEKVQIGPFGSQLHRSDYIENGIPLINPVHIKKLKIVPNSKITINKKKYEELENYHLKSGDIIMARRGEMGRCALVTNKEENYFCGTGSLYIRPNKEKINSIFLVQLISDKSIVSYLENNAKGITMKNLNKSIIASIPIIKVPIDLQNQFAKIIENIELQKQELKTSLKESEDLFNGLLQEIFN